MGMGEAPEFIGRPKRVLDLCTGSGCLAIVAAHVFPDAKIDAIELSPDAADVAQKNIDESGFKNRIELLRGDLFAPAAGRTYDLIITNPPYVDAEGMSLLTPEYEHEPRMALESGAEDVQSDAGEHTIYTAPDQLYAVANGIKERGLSAASIKLAYIPLNTVTLTDVNTARAVLKLYDMLDDLDDTQNLHTNFEIADDIVDQLEA